MGAKPVVQFVVIAVDVCPLGVIGIGIRGRLILVRSQRLQNER
jgi:hypothetical protein